MEAGKKGSPEVDENQLEKTPDQVPSDSRTDGSAGGGIGRRTWNNRRMAEKSSG